MVLAPLNPAFASLNLAQAVLLLGYEWYQAAADAPARRLPLGRSPAASKEELLGLFAHLERELDRSGFLRNEEKRPTMVRNIRNMLDRAGLTRQEVRTGAASSRAWSSPRDSGSGARLRRPRLRPGARKLRRNRVTGRAAIVQDHRTKP